METETHNKGFINVRVPVHIKEYLLIKAEQQNITLSHLINHIFIKFINDDKLLVLDSDTLKALEKAKLNK